jgi:ABC-type multidrug transport system ATPase subunit
MGIIQPNRGEVTLAGQPLTASSALKEGFAFVPQDFGLVSILTAIETIALPLQASSIGREEVRERSTRWLGALGLESCANRTVEKLSGGQRQRVAIARALAMEADLIVLDEPTAELDPTNRALVLSLLVDELTRGAMLIVVSHESDVIAHADPLYELPAF